MAIENIFDEASQKLDSEVINLANITSYFVESSNDKKSYEEMKIPFIDKYYNYLKSNISTINFDQAFTYKPEYVSYMLYATASYDYLILHANKLTSKKQFKAETFVDGKVKYYSLDSINKIIGDYAAKQKNLTKTIEISNYLLYNI